jgi:lipoprotein NlpD
MEVLKVQRWHKLLALVAVLALSACASRNEPVRGAPVESRGTSAGETAGSWASTDAPRPVDPNAGKPGYYTVKPGDTLIRIGLDTGQNWKDIARWNAMDNPNLIEVGQALRVVPPGAVVSDTGVVTRPVAAASAAPATPLGPAGASSAPKPAAPVAAASAPTSAASAPVTPVTPPAVVSSGGEGEEMGFIWPSSGTMISSFDDVKNKGVDIAGRPGDPVLAAADGKVVYAGAGLRGYGNLVILKHNNTYLTAYAHNQSLLVKEDQTVRKGQKVAEMGSSDADRVKLHFEIRRQGKPVDPIKYLPARPAP